MPSDLHCHSIHSDGSTSVKRLMELAAIRGLSAISLTDHDTFSGFEEAVYYGERYGVEVIHGTEISAYDFERKRLVHMLCYRSQRPELLETLFQKIAKNRYNAMCGAMTKISERYGITLEMVEENAKDSVTVFKSHIMKTLMEAGYTEKLYGDLYKDIFDWERGFAKTKIEYPDVYEVIELIHDAGGIAVLAHPDVYNTVPALPKLIAAGIDGIECSYPRCKAETKEILLKAVQENNLLKTGGTDFHGYSCGCVNPIGTCTTSDEDLERLKNYG